jgi:GR25 family glycosyltransferase involved in LPS biosynthesis
MNALLDGLPCYVLTAPQASEARRSHARAQLAAARLAFSFVEGPGPDAPQVRARYSAWRNLLFCKRSMAPCEVAAYLGHQAVWRRVVEGGAAGALVFEDDFRFLDPGAAACQLAAAARAVGEWDVVKLFDFRPRRPYRVLRRGDLDLAIHERPNSGLVGYVISREACRRLLQRRHVFRPVDEELRHWYAFGLSVCSTQPMLVTDGSDALGGSLLDEARQGMRARKRLARSLWGNVLTAAMNVRSFVWVRCVARRADARALAAAPGGVRAPLSPERAVRAH